jgi:hypothetical protein
MIVQEIGKVLPGFCTLITMRRWSVYIIALAASYAHDDVIVFPWQKH